MCNVHNSRVYWYSDGWQYDTCDTLTIITRRKYAQVFIVTIYSLISMNQDMTSYRIWHHTGCHHSWYVRSCTSGTVIITTDQNKLLGTLGVIPSLLIHILHRFITSIQELENSKHVVITHGSYKRWWWWDNHITLRLLLHEFID